MKIIKIYDIVLSNKTKLLKSNKNGEIIRTLFMSNK